MSVKRNGSSLRVGHTVETSNSEDLSLSFWRGRGDGTEEEGRESSRDSASWRTNSRSEREASGVGEN